MTAYPRNFAAESAYATCWTNWVFSFDPIRRRELGEIMDCLQCEIAVGPHDPRWENFISTLPGYQDFWKRWAKSIPELARR